jgi:uncharacterized protein YndB with AHSA1/START domain
MLQVEVQQVFSSSIEKVWERYTDHRAWARFGFRDRVRVTLKPEGIPAPNGLGCVRAFSAAGIEFVAEEVTAFEPPTRLMYRIVRGGWPLRTHQGEVLFAREGEGTKVTWRVSCTSAIPGSGPLLRFGLRRLFRNILRGLAAELARD